MENMIEQKHYDVVYAALTLACNELAKSNTDNIEVISYKLNGSLVGYFLMKALEELDKKFDKS
jgi:hypothetical protein